MATLREQKLAILHGIFEGAGIRWEERWRTEAEDMMVSILLYLHTTLPAYQLKQVGELLRWHAQHARGESRTSLMAMCDREGDDEGVA